MAVSEYLLDHPASKIVRQYLLDQGELDLPGSGGSWPCLLTYLLDDVDLNDVVVIYDINPNLDGRAMETGEVLFHYGVSFTLRSSDYETGYLKMFDLFKLLASVVREIVTVNTTDYTVHSISNRSGVVSMGLETGTKRRHIFEMNLLASVTKN